MFPRIIKMNVRVFYLFIVLTYANGQDRQMVSKLNMGCDRCDPKQNPLVYIRAQSSKDTIHQLWDFTDHVPAVVYAIGSPNSTLQINWSPSLSPILFNFSEPLFYSFSTAIESIIEYDDIKDNANYDPRCVSKIHPLDDMSWQLVDSILTDKEAKVVLNGDGGKRGKIEMKLDLLPFEDYATDLPHLIHTANSTLIDIKLVNLTESRDFNASRFALRFVMIGTDPPADSWSMNMRKSLDDEHTPGVFEIIEIKSPESIKSGNGGFMQFRPVAYTEAERGVSSSTNAYISSFNRTRIPRHSILRQFYKDYFRQTDTHDVVQQDMVVSFGMAGDGFYRQHNFTSWSFNFGYGSPPLEGFSMFVVIIISIGLGVPVLLTLSGIIYVLSRRCKQRNPPARFTNDE